MMTEPQTQEIIANKIADRVSELLTGKIQDLQKKREEGSSSHPVDNSIKAVYSARHEIDFSNFFGQSTEVIEILVTNLQSMEIYIGHLFDMAQKGIKVRILAIDPHNEFLRRRFIHLGFKQFNTFADEMIISLKHFCMERDIRLTPDRQENFQIRVYSSPPTLMIFKSDNRIIISYILQQGRARHLPHMEFDCTLLPDKKNPSYAFVEHFNVVWSQAEPVDLSRIGALSGSETISRSSETDS
jgi:hypothetical protein